ncbi:PREDICTED: transcription factor RF2b-like [Brassica oleracea var. oleracea]|nr:PREDICTED: transcription factor RF2b-like [Brassica oleracea var. oleracea]
MLLKRNIRDDEMNQRVGGDDKDDYDRSPSTKLEKTRSVYGKSFVHINIRDTNGLANENTELRLRLQSLEQQAQLRNALNEALRKEVERMKIETGEVSGDSDSFDMGQYSHSTFMAIPPYHSGSVNGQDMRFNQNHPMEKSNSQSVSEFLQNGRLQGLEIISNNSSRIVKSEGPSLSASESSSAY